jgi:hypothetical protein
MWYAPPHHCTRGVRKNAVCFSYPLQDALQCTATLTSCLYHGFEPQTHADKRC